jgi:hypothetical protein
MKFALVLLLGVALGAVVSVATTKYLAQNPTSTPAETVERAGRAIEDAVAGGVRRIQGEAAAAKARSSDAGGAMTRDAATPVREKNSARLGRLVVRSAEERSKRRQEWTFLSETALAGELGLPDEIAPDAKGGETWYYDFPFSNSEGAKDTARIGFRINHGRVIDIDGAEDFK